MQYPQIQFYRGSLVRLASGRLKQVEELSSDDFLESARLARAPSWPLPARPHATDSPTPMELAGPSWSPDQEQPDDEDPDLELDVVSHDEPEPKRPPLDEVRVALSQVRDFLEVGPPGPNSPAAHSAASEPATPPTVLIKFFLEPSRSVVFIEKPVEHPFFVFQRGWSSWNPQLTYDKFGLKCRKLKIGDTCISLIRLQPRSVDESTSRTTVPTESAPNPSHLRPPDQLLRRQLHSSLLQPQHTLQQQQYHHHHHHHYHHNNNNNQQQHHQQESDHCNIMFSSIKINE